MFNNKTNKDNTAGENGVASINLIGAGTVVEGDIKAQGDIRIDGTVYGSVSSKAKVVIGSTGVIEGDMNSLNADVSGNVRGKTTVSELLFLKSTANMIGDIVTGKLIVEVGATFTGSCNMGPMIKDINNNDKQTNQEKAAY